VGSQAHFPFAFLNKSALQKGNQIYSGTCCHRFRLFLKAQESLFMAGDDILFLEKALRQKGPYPLEIFS